MPIQAVITKGRVPIKIWDKIENVESGAIDQLVNCANLPFVFKHVAVMPDVHWGRGATIGSVIATKGAICPASVGVDIGCGMRAIKTTLDYKKVCDKLPELRHSIERAIPVGTYGNLKLSKSVENWDGWNFKHSLDRDNKLVARSISQLGSLGGGNHFIEICLSYSCSNCIGGVNGGGNLICDTCNGTAEIKDPAVWVMLHSGSRNIGKTLADYHISKAKGLMKQMLIGLPDPDLAYLPENTEEFKEYLIDLIWAQSYAKKNRNEMMYRVLRELSYMFNDKQPISIDREIDCHHNYVEREHHYGENVLVTRKGAVRARKGDFGIIPGSMGTRSYIVYGLGNKESFDSCSHGAGRKMSRSKAKLMFTKEDLEFQTKGVECRKDLSIIDEAPLAYKNIEEVMANQTDLVEVVAELKQILCIKG